MVKATDSRRLTDWFQAYQDYTSLFEPPGIFNKWVAILILSVATGRKIWLQEGQGRVYPNLYVVLVGPSGTGKTSAMREGLPFIEKVKVARSPAKITGAQLLKHMEASGIHDDQFGIYTPYLIWAEELPSYLGPQAYESGMLSDLTTLWDNPLIFDKQTATQGSPTIPQPYVCLLGGTTAGGIFDVLPPGSIGQGFTSRILFICAIYAEKRVPEKPWLPIHDKLSDGLKHDIERIAQLRGPMQVSDMARILWTDFYMHRANPEEEFSDTRLQGYSSRKPLYLKKLAMLLSVAESDNMIIEAHHIEKAIQLLSTVDASLYEAYTEMAPSPIIALTARILKRLEKAPNQIMKHSELFRKFSYTADARMFKEAIQSLIDQQRVEVSMVQSGTRIGILYKLILDRKEEPKDEDVSLR